MQTYRAAEAFDALGEPTRREILERLRTGPKPVGEIAAGMSVSRPAVSQHLRVLKGAGLVSGRKEGTRHLYRVENEGLDAVRRYLEELWDTALAGFKEFAERASEEE